MGMHVVLADSRAPAHQVEKLLKHGAYDVFKDGKGGEEASKKFCEDSIDAILSRAKVPCREKALCPLMSVRACHRHLESSSVVNKDLCSDEDSNPSLLFLTET